MNIIETERVLHHGIQQGEIIPLAYIASLWIINLVAWGAFVRQTLRIAQETD